MSVFTEGVLHCPSGPLRYAQSGKGPAVVMFSSAGGTLVDDVATALAADYRLLVLDVSNASSTGLQQFATNVVSALAKLGVTSFNAIGASQGVTFAFAHAVYTPTAVNRLILVSPPLASIQDPGLSNKLPDITVPTLILVGTRDRTGSREAGRLCRAHIPASHLLLVYEAGAAIMTDRREACLSPIREFLAQGEGFIVTHESQLIRP